MTLFKFNSLGESEQQYAVKTSGVLIGHMVDGTIKITLYKLFSFYVELFHQIENMTLIGLRSFSDTELSDSDISQFNLGSLIDSKPS